jgi:Putative transposase
VHDFLEQSCTVAESLHYIATGGGLSADGRWRTSRQDFLVHVKPLSILFRAKFRDLLKQTDLFRFLDPQVWRKDWVVHSQTVGSGEAAFKYLAPYIFRVAISNRRILALEDGQVTFSYKDSATDRTKFSTIPAEEFIGRFLQHILPKGFVKSVTTACWLSPTDICLTRSGSRSQPPLPIQIPQNQIASGKTQASLLDVPSAERP